MPVILDVRKMWIIYIFRDNILFDLLYNSKQKDEYYLG
jgi:hypothetical protein